MNLNLDYSPDDVAAINQQLREFFARTGRPEPEASAPPSPPRRLPIYGHSQEDRRALELLNDEGFASWVCERSQIRRYALLADTIDEHDEVSIEGLRTTLEPISCDDDEDEAVRADEALDELIGASSEWLARKGTPEGAVGRFAYRMDNAGPPEHRCHFVAKPISPWPETPGVYFVLAETRVKIGKARNVRKRLADLQTSAPFALSLLAVAPGGLPEEGAYHRRFAAHRRVGEWFDFCPPLVAEIARLRGAQ